MKALLSLVLLAASTANAADNGTLFVCETQDTSITSYFYKGPGNGEPKRVRLTIGQDKSESMPRFEIGYDLIGQAGELLPMTGKNTLRIAYAESAQSGRATATYSPSRSSGAQGVRPFSLLIDQNVAKLTFLQINSGGAPKATYELSCSRGGHQVVDPKPVVLADLSDYQRLSTLETLKKALTQRPEYFDDDRTGLPPGVTAEAMAPIKAKLESLEITDEAIKKRVYVSSNKAEFKITPPGPDRCGELKWSMWRPIRDFTGQVVAYEGNLVCSNVAVVQSYPVHNGTVREEKYVLTYRGFYVGGSILVNPRSADYDFTYLPKNP